MSAMRQKQTYKDGWIEIDRTHDPEQYVRFMDRINQGDKEEGLLLDSQTFKCLDSKEGNHILEIGCGTGGAARALARIVGPTGRVVGVDISETMLAEARKRTDAALAVEFVLADVHHLPFADGAFDRCCATNVFEILADPRQALHEMVRVLRPGGKLVVPAPDYGSMAIDGADRAVTRAILNYICDVETNGWVGRQLPNLFVETGLKDVHIDVQACVCNDFVYFFEGWLGSYLANAHAAGVLTTDELVAWLNDQQERYWKEVFFATYIAFLVSGYKP